MSDLIQITIHRPPDATVETLKGTLRWDKHLENMAREMRKHGRVVEIIPARITGDLALYANQVAHSRKEVMRDATVVNVRGME